MDSRDLANHGSGLTGRERAAAPTPGTVNTGARIVPREPALPQLSRRKWTPSAEAVRFDRPRCRTRRLAWERVMSSGWIGRRVVRKEDHRFLTG